MTDLEIGGYFELELLRRGGFLHDDGVLVNSGRNALEYILKSLPDIHHLKIPFYTCEVILEPLVKLGIQYSFYHINEKLEIQDDIQLKGDEYLLYTNYFGVKDQYVRKLAGHYGNRLIVDNAQAYYSDPLPGIRTFYSPRKFFGIPDGGIAYCPEGERFDEYEFDYSYDRFSHLLKRIDLGPEEGYSDFRKNGASLSNLPIRKMSRLTRSLLSSIDFDFIRGKRAENFRALHAICKESNHLDLGDSLFSCPMVYPYLTDNPNLRDILIHHKVFVATYWPNVLKWTTKEDMENSLTKLLIPLPIDQRYSADELTSIQTLLK